MAPLMTIPIGCCSDWSQLDKRPARTPRRQTRQKTEATRRHFLEAASCLLLNTGWLSKSLAEPSSKKLDPKFLSAFNKALSLASDPKKAEDAWTDTIALDPTNSYAWSNRGTLRLQQGQWQKAQEDLQKAYEIETNSGDVSGVLSNNLGNVKGALGDWEGAMKMFEEATMDSELSAIATANLALALFQVERDDEAIQKARMLLRKDPNFLDMRAALTGFLWATRQESDAEGEWTRLQSDNDGLGGMMYDERTAIKRVQGRWPPRAVAALDAFLRVSRKGTSLNYDKSLISYGF